jgi:aminopeptidase N
VKDKESEFYFPLESAPQIVRLDPDYTLLAKTTLNLPNDMLYAQLADREDVMGRLLAIEQLKDKKDQETVAKLKEALNNDPFYGVRNEAASALRSIHTDEALEALLASTDQPTRACACRSLAPLSGFYRDTAYAFGAQGLETKKTRSFFRSIGRLGKYAQPEVRTC